MDSLIIAATQESPGINFDKENFKFLIFGKSFPEESRHFFDPIIMWLEDYIKEPNANTSFEVRLEYYNSATSTILLEMLYILKQVLNDGKNLKVVWNYVEMDDDMLDAGKEFEEMIKIPFEYQIIEDY